MKDPRALIGQAYARVDRGDWSRWIPHPADPVLMLPMAPYIPPLTQGMVMGFVNFHAWLAGQPPDVFQYQGWEQRFRAAWQTSDRAAIRDFLATLLLSSDLLLLSRRKRESIRVPLGRLLWEGSARPEPPSWRLPDVAPSQPPAPREAPPREPAVPAEPAAKQQQSRRQPAEPAAKQQQSEGQPSPLASLSQMKLEHDMWMNTMDASHTNFMKSLEVFRH